MQMPLPISGIIISAKRPLHLILSETNDIVKEAIKACDRDNRAFLVAEDGGNLLGLLHLFSIQGRYQPCQNHGAYDLNPPSGKRRGDRARFDGAFMCACQSGRSEISWAGVSADNPAGVAFHERIGFSTIARLPQVGFKFDR